MSVERLGIATGFLAYLVMLGVIGVLAWRRTRVLSDFVLGGRRLGRWVAALSAGASDMSGWLLLGLPGLAYAAGLEALWLALGLLVGTYLNWRVVARRLRAYSEMAGDALTLPAFLEQRFADQGHLLRVIAGGFILLFFTFYTSSGLVAGGRLFETVFDLPYAVAVAAGAGAILLYAFFGGFLAVSWTDLVQALLMAGALLIVPVAALIELGGPGAAAAKVRAVEPALLDPLTTDDGRALPAIALLSLLGWGLGYFGQPHILARFQAIRSAEAVAGARRIAVTWTALTLAGATTVGLAGFAFVSEPLVGGATETVFLVLVQALFHPLVSGVLLAAVLAAIMSTADSQLLVSSSVLAEDFYRALLRPGADDRELMRVARLAVALVAAVALWLAMEPGRLVLELVAYAWAGFGAAFGPVVILSLYWRRMNRMGALLGMIGGGVTVVVWGSLEGGLFELYEIVPGCLVATAAAVVASLATAPPPRAIVERHDELFAERHAKNPP